VWEGKEVGGTQRLSLMLRVRRCCLPSRLGTSLMSTSTHRIAFLLISKHHRRCRMSELHHAEVIPSSRERGCQFPRWSQVRSAPLGLLDWRRDAIKYSTPDCNGYIERHRPHRSTFSSPRPPAQRSSPRLAARAARTSSCVWAHSSVRCCPSSSRQSPQELETAVRGGGRQRRWLLRVRASRVASSGVAAAVSEREIRTHRADPALRHAPAGPPSG